MTTSTRIYDLYIYDSTNDGATNYDHVLVAPSTAGKNGAPTAADLEAGEWADMKVKLIGARAGQTAGFYVKAIELAPDLSKFRLYFTSIARVNATYNGWPAGSATFEETLALDFPTSTAADFAPLEAGIVDEDTYVEQGLKWKDAHFGVPPLHHRELGVEPDLLMLGNPVTDEFSTSSWRSITPTDMDGDPNPYYDDVTNDDVPDGRVAIREGYIRAAYAGGGRDPRARAELWATETTSSSAPTTASRRSGTRSTPARCCATPGSDRAETAQLPPARRAPDEGEGLLGGRDGADLRQPRRPRSGRHRSVAQYERVRNQIVAAFQSLTDPADPGAVVLRC